ncbi:tripartite tricarboxylate transporter substrate binding protein [Pigmentiphaga sp. GD03639]|nr:MULTISPECIES: tripartite tricarboxylate transporter substrate binding protein [unclassified Pigmentiphaga]MDH2237951.1 tripartite tricarboxylate transporter substrate binding protein [Pigmentiphaga sp. GD03639]
MKKTITAAAAAFMLANTPAFGQASKYPAKPVRIVSAFSTGSGADAMLRIVADRLSKAWGQAVVVENKPGGTGFIAAADVMRSPADGYTLFHADGLNFTAVPHLYKKIPYDAQKDFVPVIPLHHSNFFIAVSSQSKWNSAGDLLAAAKAAPGRVTYGSWQIGSVAHLAGAALETASGTHMTHVPFKDVGQLYASVANGDVDWAFGTPGSAGPLQQAGKLKFIGWAGTERLATYPDVPLVGESGGPAGFQVSGWVGLFAPAGTPKTLVDQVNKDVTALYSQADIPPKMIQFGYMPLLIKPQEVSALIRKESEAYAKIVKENNLTLDQ